MLRPEEVLALSTIVKSQIAEARGKQQQHFSGNFQYNNGSVGQAGWISGGTYEPIVSPELDILKAYVSWMLKARELYIKNSSEYAGLSLAEFIAKQRQE